MGGVFTPFNEIPLLPKYKNTTAARWYVPVQDGYTAGSSTPTVNVRYFHLIYVPADGQIDLLSFAIGTAPASAYNINLAIWNCLDDATVGSYVIGGSGSSGTTTSARVNISVTASNVVRGYYWMSFTAAATPGGNISTTQSNGALAYSRFLGTLSTLANQYVIWNYTCLTSYDQTTHETFNLSTPTGLQTSIPSMGWQYV
jgi:hypothetical protein